jgi:uncharacterized YccA/Bax inhibitor family protein
MASPVLSRNSNFEPRYTGFDGSPREMTREITVESVLQKSLVSFGVLLAAAVVSWVFVNPIFLLVGVFGGLVLGLVNSFKREPSPALILAYAGLEGLALGSLSHIFEDSYSNIVLQAVLGTFAVVAATLVLFRFANVRATARLNKIFMIAMVGYLLYLLLNAVLVWTGAVQDPFGLSGSVTIFGIPLGIVLGLFAVVLGAYSLITDFTFIENAVRNKVADKYGWTAAFGIMVTVVWLYVEILRLLAIARR